jgi:predicted amidohydrolase YtcJ
MAERASANGHVLGGEEAVTVEQALAACTMGAAYACRREHVLGSVSAGKLADLVVLGDDPRRVDVSRITGIEVLATVVDGEFAYGGEAFGV